MIPDEQFFSSRTLDAIAPIQTALAQGQELTSAIRQLRAFHAREVADFILLQAQLRKKAEAKFPVSLIGKLLFTRQGLEQATGSTLAGYKASLLPTGTRSADLCCGIGGDLLALDARGCSTGVDHDPLSARIAAHNLEVAGKNGSWVVLGRVEDFDTREYAFVHLDPDRRAGGMRTSRAEAMQPSWEWIRKRFQLARAAIKLAPACQLSAVPEGMVRQWIGFDRECREQLGWLNADLPFRGPRVATVINESGKAESISGDIQAGSTRLADCKPDGWLIEPHSAVFAAGLGEALRAKTAGDWLSHESPYLIADNQPATRLAQSFRIVTSGALHKKQLMGALDEFDAGLIEWKQRGVPVTKFDSFRKIQRNGSRSCTVVLFRIAAQLRFVLCHRDQGLVQKC